jgi:hypothetical protein
VVRWCGVVSANAHRWDGASVATPASQVLHHAMLQPWWCWCGY